MPDFIGNIGVDDKNASQNKQKKADYCGQQTGEQRFCFLQGLAYGYLINYIAVFVMLFQLAVMNLLFILVINFNGGKFFRIDFIQLDFSYDNIGAGLKTVNDLFIVKVLDDLCLFLVQCFIHTIDQYYTYQKIKKYRSKSENKECVSQIIS
jgi:hypothetical protein